MKSDKYAVWIGRFQPFHLGHERVLSKIREEFDNVIIILGVPKIGDRFSFEERKIFLTFLCTEMGFSLFHIMIHFDYEDWDKWALGITESLNNPNKCCLIKAIKKKDLNEDGKHYLDFLTDNGYFKESMTFIAENELSATDIRTNPIENINNVHLYLRKMFLSKYK